MQGVYSMKVLSLIVCCLCVILQGSYGQNAGRELAKLHNEFFAWRMSDRPEVASGRGVRMYDDQLESYNMSMFDVRKDKAVAFHNRLINIPQSELSFTDLVSYKILDDMLTAYIDGYNWRFYLHINPITLMDGLQRNPPSSLVNLLPYNTRGDFENYIARLHKLPQQYAEIKEMLKKAIELGRTQHNHSMIHAQNQFKALLVNASDSIFYTPFKDRLENSSVDERYRAELRSEGLVAVSDVIEAIRDISQFIKVEYMPNTRSGIGVGSLDNGLQFYEACIRWYLSINMTAKQVFDRGIEEVIRISGRMQEIMRKQGFEGTISGYFKKLMNDTRFFFDTGEEMLAEYRHQIFDVIDPTLDEYFKDNPRLPIEVRAMLNDGPSGSYSTGSADGSRPGIFWANVMRPESSINITMMALTIHEADPGHHMQRSFQITSDLPDFRQKMEWSSYNRAPFAFPSYNAYTEGWALYAEFLGEEMGLYRSDYELMGRFSSEIFRACRLVVDTGIHAFDWTRDQAIEYMLNYTAKSYDAIAVEVDRYISVPGQALSYKIGELKIRELRDMAEKRLGDKFDIREFHAVVINSGTLPLSVLEDVVNNWLDSSEMDSTTPAPGVTCSSSAPSIGLLVLFVLTVLSSTLN